MIEENQNKLFFIMGVGRSGTSLLQEIMNTFLGFCNNKESRIYDNEIFSLWTPVRKSGNFKELEKFIKENWISEYFVEKTPDSILCLPQLYLRYPNANYIFLERNPTDIVLSQLNMFQGGLDVLERDYHIKNLIMNEDDLVLNREQYYAKMTLKQIYYQTQNKDKFSNKITIKYESLKNSLYSNLVSLEKEFGIKSNNEEAFKTISKPSYSSKVSKYEIKELRDPQALAMLNTACRLWGYIN